MVINMVVSRNRFVKHKTCFSWFILLLLFLNIIIFFNSAIAPYSYIDLSGINSSSPQRTSVIDSSGNIYSI
jgi:hypothetical protein